MEDILDILPNHIREKIINVGSSNDLVSEIRLRVNRNIIMYIANKELVIDYKITLKDLLDILYKVSSHSIYAIQSEINQGFVTIKGGHRIGISGEVVVENGKILNIKNINSMNIRVAKQLIGVADKVLPKIVKNEYFQNTLIISPPGCGKTTMLRDVVRQISNGIPNLKFKGLNVGVVDERGEIASSHNGVNGLDIGLRTDVISNVDKSTGIEMLVRSMGINVIATDEIGSDSDIEAIKYAALSGVNLLFTMHGKSIDDVYKKNKMKDVLDLFDNIVVLSNSSGIGTVEKVHKLRQNEMEVI